MRKSENGVSFQRAVVQMDEQREQHITQLLNSVQRDAGRDAQPSTSQSWRVKEETSGHRCKCNIVLIIRFT